MGFIKNINAWKGKTASAKARVKSSATEYVRARVLVVYKDVLRVSPQWSGNYAYNWQIEITGQQAGGWDKRFKVTPWQALVRNPKQAGDPEAINAALLFAKEIISQIKWNSRVTLVNNSPVSELIESGQVTLRPVNMVTPAQGIQSYLKSKYRYIT